MPRMPRQYPNGVGAPHAFPYQGSKRKLTSIILDRLPRQIETLYEPFAGSAAVSVAAAHKLRAARFVINDTHSALVELWRAILDQPRELSDGYERLWQEQSSRQREFFNQVRSRFNEEHRPADFLYLLARCVKAAVRYNSRGEFNNSPDNRRLGMQPSRMRANILAVSSLLSGRTQLSCVDFSEAIRNATPNDVVYMDPPYQGVTNTPNHRYQQGHDRDHFIATLENLNTRGVPYIVSYDGKTGDKLHGQALPQHLRLHHEYVQVGPSTQATLNGDYAETVESLYLSPNLLERLVRVKSLDNLSLFDQPQSKSLR